MDDSPKSNDFDLGDKVSIETPAGKTLDFTVRGNGRQHAADVFGDVTTTDTTVDRDFGQHDDAVDLIKATPGADPKTVQARIDRVLDAQFPTVESKNQQQYKDTSPARSTRSSTLYTRCCRCRSSSPCSGS